MTTRIRNIGGTVVPSASTTVACACADPECEHAHLVGYDEEGKPFCEIVVSEDIILKAFTIINDRRKP